MGILLPYPSLKVLARVFMGPITQSSHGNSILVVEEDLRFRERLAQGLKHERFVVTTAACGTEALGLLNSQRQFDLVIITLELHDLDGLRVISAMRRNPKLRELPAILIAEHADAETIRGAARLGIRDYLLKSRFTLNELVYRMTRHLCADARAEAPPSHQEEGARPKTGLRAGSEDAHRPTWDAVNNAIAASPFPPILHYVLEKANDPDSAMRDIVEAIRLDPSLTTQVMKTANTCFAGAARGTRTLEQAATRIGVNGIRNTVITATTMRRFATPIASVLSAQRFWEHALVVARFSYALGGRVDPQMTDQLYLAGLMKDLGRLLLAEAQPSKFTAAVVNAARHGRSLSNELRELLGVTPNEVTERVLREAGFPEVVWTVAGRLEQCDKDLLQATKHRTETMIIALADRLARSAAVGESFDAMITPIDVWIDALRLDCHDVFSMFEESLEGLDETKELVASCLRGPLLPNVYDEFLAEIPRNLRVSVCAPGRPCELLSLFFQKLNLISAAQPTVAVMLLRDGGDLEECLTQLEGADAAACDSLPVVICSPVEIPADELAILGSRPSRVLQMPIPHHELLAQCCRLHGAKAATA